MTPPQTFPNHCSVIDCGLGNIGSIVNMVKKCGASASVALSPDQCLQKGPLILPGVGSFDYGMQRLIDTGFREYIINSLSSSDRLLIGICLGMQMLFDCSDEGINDGLSLIPGRVLKFKPSSREVKIPHMGWNTTLASSLYPQFNPVLDRARFYFVHSFHAECDSQYILSTTTHGITFPSSVISSNILGFQFHPEKSHIYGMNLFRHIFSSF